MDNQLGSRWMTLEELDKFYEDAGLNYLSDTVRIHAQEVIIPTDEEKELVVLREQRINLKRALKEVINAVECQRGDPDEWCTKATTEARKVMTEN